MEEGEDDCSNNSSSGSGFSQHRFSPAGGVLQPNVDSSSVEVAENEERDRKVEMQQFQRRFQQSNSEGEEEEIQQKPQEEIPVNYGLLSFKRGRGNGE